MTTDSWNRQKVGVTKPKPGTLPFTNTGLEKLMVGLNENYRCGRSDYGFQGILEEAKNFPNAVKISSGSLRVAAAPSLATQVLTGLWP